MHLDTLRYKVSCVLCTILCVYNVVNEWVSNMYDILTEYRENVSYAFIIHVRIFHKV